jgi:hypothetical protein
MPVLSTQTDGLFNAAAEVSAGIQLTPKASAASITFVKSGATTSFEFAVYASNGGLRYAIIEGMDAVTAEGAYPLGGPWTHIKVLCDAMTLGAGAGVLVDLCWVYD